MDIGQNTSYRSNIGQKENIGIGIGGRYVGANIYVSVSAKISAGKIYMSNPIPHAPHFFFTSKINLKARKGPI
jgi:hypothetical protein